MAPSLKQLRTADQDDQTLGAGGGYVETVQAEKKVHAAGRVVDRRCGHRIDNDRRLLPLELVDRSDPGTARKCLNQPPTLRVVWRDNKNVLNGDRTRCSVPIGPRQANECAEGLINAIDFF